MPDELEVLADDPSTLPATDPGGSDVIYTFSRPVTGVTHHLAVTLARNDDARRLTVLGIAWSPMDSPPPEP